MPVRAASWSSRTAVSCIDASRAALILVGAERWIERYADSIEQGPERDLFGFLAIMGEIEQAMRKGGTRGRDQLRPFRALDGFGQFGPIAKASAPSSADSRPICSISRL